MQGLVDVSGCVVLLGGKFYLGSWFQTMSLGPITFELVARQDIVAEPVSLQQTSGKGKERRGAESHFSLQAMLPVTSLPPTRLHLAVDPPAP